MESIEQNKNRLWIFLGFLVASFFLMGISAVGGAGSWIVV
jgi:hypothetical protein